nr:FtsX-like permease family protein [uncultured Carboxylicivirga sp.]
MRNLRISLRHLKTDKTNTLISIAGLIIGLGIVASVITYVINELNYNQSIANKNRIYRVLHFDSNDHHYWATTPFAVGEQAKIQLAEVESVVHQYNMDNIEVQKGNEFIPEPDMMSCESSFFSAFGVKILQGSLIDFDETSKSIALSRQLAEKYFANQNPLGQELTLRYGGQKYVMEVTAVFNDISQNSTVKPKLLTNIDFGLQHLASNLISSGEMPTADQLKQDWGMSLMTTYLMLKKDVDQKAFEAKLKKIGEENATINMPMDLALQSLSDIYFSSIEIRNSGNEKGNKSMLILMLVMGLLILLVAIINYLNLASARLMAQTKNYAVRRVCGAGNKSIVNQIITESTIITLVALPFALLFAWYAMPVVSQMLGKTYTIEFSEQIVLTLILLFGLTLVSGIVAGLLVSYKVSRVSMAIILKGNKHFIGSKHYARKAMVVFQFVVFIVLISVTFLVQKQVKYTFNKDLGFNKEGLVTIPLGDHNLDLFKEEILKNPSVLSASGTLWMPPSDNNIFMTLPKVSHPDEKVNVNALFVDYDFVKTMGLELITGSDFEKSKGNGGVIVNQLAAKELGLTTVVGEEIAWGKVVGLVNDFNMSSLHQKISPMLIVLKRDMCKNIAVRLRSENLAQSIDFLEKTWNKTGGTTSFSYEFPNDIIREMYQAEIRFSQTIGLLAVIAISIASLGLLGLSLLIGKQRTKEVGIRKVNGAKISEILTLLNKDFIKWVAIAFVIATPIAWFAMNKWLENFAYKTSLSWWIFALAGLLALAIALLTVSYQSWKAATRNPVEALRYE